MAIFPQPADNFENPRPRQFESAYDSPALVTIRISTKPRLPLAHQYPNKTSNLSVNNSVDSEGSDIDQTFLL